MSRRTERVAEAIRRISSEMIHSELRDPRIHGFITITKVEVTADLRYAKIFYSVLGDDKTKKSAAKGLQSAKNFMRMHIAQELKLRYAPDIVFKIDEKIEHSKRIDVILDQLQKERDNNVDTENRSRDQEAS